MSISFESICSLLLPEKKEKENIRVIISNWFRNQRGALDDPETNGGAVLSALFPHLRKDRVYGLQTPSLAKKLEKLLAFNHGQSTLFNGWKTGTYGDLGVYVERAMKKWDGTWDNRKTGFSLERIDRLLVQLASRNRFSNENIRRKRNYEFETDTELWFIFRRLKSWEAKWLVRMLLRNHCTIELDEKYVFGCYHFLLPELLMFQNDFDTVFGMLKGELSCYPPAPEPSEQMAMRIEAAQKLKPVVGLVGNGAWAAEVKYDGEYCEIHVDLDNAEHPIRIFSKNGKDATADRRPLHDIIRKALRIGRPDCLFKKKCIVLGEMVVYSDREKKIMPFSKIRKHVSRSGSFLGTLQDDVPHEWEHLMIVFFDILVLDDQPILRHCLQERRDVLRNLVHSVPGRSMRSNWSLLSSKTGEGITDLKQAFVRTLAERQEGLVLKPLHEPYFPLLLEQGSRQAGFFIKMKKDSLGDMGGERDLGDFAVVGASFDAQVAAKTDVKPLHWTHFHLGCCINTDAVERTGAKPRFKVVATLSLEKCIPKADVKWLNTQGYVRQGTLQEDGSTREFDIVHSKSFDRRMAAVFKKPFVAEILGGGSEQVQNESFEMLRHPRIRKIHSDRTWEDCVTMADLERLAEEKWTVPDADKLDGHARDIALYAKKYIREMGGSQLATTDSTTEETTQCTTPRYSKDSPRLPLPSNSVVQETPPQYTSSPVFTTHVSAAGSTQAQGIRASRLPSSFDQGQEQKENVIYNLLPAPFLPTPGSTGEESGDAVAQGQKRSADQFVSPPKTKRIKVQRPLQPVSGNTDVRSFQVGYNEEERVLHVWTGGGVKVEVQERAFGKRKE
ncbi:CDC9 ATP-dependent DNA ligase [Pyrenophora tritici-repentis]|uniref:ATP-dependent DNA ligase family profile domain-containing protein n=1 Tax=Pyrenophora tritici-repentis (strain Pt-1C-BFP) TaxID=426418 RepID=B2WLV1_PYRTR|nr:uncharacterized protein PTRG_10961 [Pyrenophora tritici-repentis Pt-1C-BFP]EDU44011.1 conserved hypothetical protein [Pyrenophora tritici-repentis Pt-1C-BFP]KAF7442900.1 CDC9 ATP-dependent DNA ligase [Pyrenophora tritici-repentis]KAI1532244.1 CDC9 ATP-dependent DNA ligase [Pyrenophora tritici-repentis]PZC95960.1 CDC9, ATP-dependent DNA ligase [Pyrenophora tritici-repentis]